MARHRFRFRLSGVLLAAALLLVFFHSLGWLNPISGAASWALSPFQQRLYSFGNWFSGMLAGDTTSKDVMKDNRELQLRVDGLLVENAQLRSLLDEQGIREEQRDFLAVNGMRAIESRLLGRNPEPSPQLLIINRGYQDGVRAGMPVIAGPGVLIGKIAAVHTRTAEVLLTSDSQSQVAANLDGQTQQTSGVVTGERGLTMKMELIPSTVAVMPGEVVVTSGLEPNVPAGLVIGEVDRVVQSDNTYFQTAFLKSLTDFNRLTVVSVLITEVAIDSNE